MRISNQVMHADQMRTWWGAWAGFTDEGGWCASTQVARCFLFYVLLDS
jgi:hypothetical protein